MGCTASGSACDSLRVKMGFLTHCGDKFQCLSVVCSWVSVRERLSENSSMLLIERETAAKGRHLTGVWLLKGEPDQCFGSSQIDTFGDSRAESQSY